MDENSFGALYRGSSRQMVGVTYALCGDLAEAQDCVQEAFTRAWLERRTLERHPNPAAWVQLTALRLAVSRWRRMRTADRVLRRVPLPPPVGEPDALHVDVVRALGHLPERTRTVVVLHYLVDWPVKDIAAGLDMPVNTVTSHLMRGRAALRAQLLPETAEESPHA